MEILTVTLNPALDREVIIPNFQLNQLHRIFNRENMIMDPGGKGINVSMMLSSLGIPSLAMGFLGGYTGRVILEELRRRFKDVTTNFVRMEEESRENLAIVDEMNHSITEINAMGPTIMEEDLLHFLRLYQTAVSHTKISLISGSAPFGIPLDVYASLSKMAKEQGNWVLMEARGRLLTNAVNQACPHVVRPDLRSDNKILGQEVESFSDYLDAGREIIHKGAELVVISYQMKHDLIFTRDASWFLTIIQESVDPSHLLGTGDVYMTAMIYNALKNGKDLLATAKFGMAAALAKTHYVKKEMPKLEDIQTCMEHIKVERLD
ncbi:MAG TPA: 1-phosphofructokinase family hexose kinase [Thermotogota bacterium]|nr:1-phosphofructokinase family hexose kinase [Thermotogota bacterium]HRW91712.1 1-phosphofructokinase family hexose kinase [Thermotogota bacterium]